MNECITGCFCDIVNSSCNKTDSFSCGKKNIAFLHMEEGAKNLIACPEKTFFCMYLSVCFSFINATFCISQANINSAIKRCRFLKNVFFNALNSLSICKCTFIPIRKIGILRAAKPLMCLQSKSVMFVIYIFSQMEINFINFT